MRALDRSRLRVQAPKAAPAFLLHSVRRGSASACAAATPKTHQFCKLTHVYTCQSLLKHSVHVRAAWCGAPPIMRKSINSACVRQRKPYDSGLVDGTVNGNKYAFSIKLSRPPKIDNHTGGLAQLPKKKRAATKYFNGIIMKSSATAAQSGHEQLTC